MQPPASLPIKINHRETKDTEKPCPLRRQERPSLTLFLGGEKDKRRSFDAGTTGSKDSYSARSARTGSILAARLAGTYAAPSTIIATVAAVPANT